MFCLDCFTPLPKVKICRHREDVKQSAISLLVPDCSTEISFSKYKCIAKPFGKLNFSAAGFRGYQLWWLCYLVTGIREDGEYKFGSVEPGRFSAPTITRAVEFCESALDNPLHQTKLCSAIFRRCSASID